MAKTKKCDRKSKIRSNKKGRGLGFGGGKGPVGKMRRFGRGK